MPIATPNIRLRRLRENPKLRNFVGEHALLSKELIQPLFVKEGLTRPVEIGSMPGQFQWSEKALIEEAQRLDAAGATSVMLFGIPTKKDKAGVAAFAGKGIVQRAVRAIKKKTGLLVITDVCLCEYLDHGHCGHIQRGKIHNDTTLKTLAKISLSHANAGADIIAPSDMMDGRVRAIRHTLDKNGFENTPIMSYAVKYASGFYGPFREAAESAPQFGDRKSYQMNPANRREALREAEEDIREGADFLMVKPALAYLDVLHELKQKFNCPIGCYSVSGEYSMIKAAAANRWVDEKSLVLETHLAMKRAGANFIVSYWTKDLLKWKMLLKGVSL